jgi:hypothetical protein
MLAKVYMYVLQAAACLFDGFGHYSVMAECCNETVGFFTNSIFCNGMKQLDFLIFEFCVEIVGFHIL